MTSFSHFVLKDFSQLYFTMNKFVFFLLFVGCLTSLGQKTSQTAQRLPQQSIKSVPKSETTLQLLAKHGKGTIRLRWVAQTPEIWALGHQYGYILERTTVIRNNKTLAKPEDFKTITLLPFSEQEWSKLARTDDQVRAAQSFYFYKPEELAEKDTSLKSAITRGKFAFSSIAADFSSTVANLMRLSFEDSLVKSNEIYHYTIKLNHPDFQKLKAETRVTAGMSWNIKAYTPQKLVDLDYVDSTVTLKWVIPQQAIFTGYVIERSADGGVSYERVNQAPFVPIENSPKEKDAFLYTTKVPKLMLNYYYRIRGIDPFAEQSDPSNSVKVFAFQSRLPEPDSLLSNFLNKRTVGIRWRFPDSLTINLQGFNVYKTLDFKNFTKVNKEVVSNSTRTIFDRIEDGIENIYYTVAAVDLRGRQKTSEPLLVNIIDSIPPMKLMNLHGKINKKGITRIGWTHGKERDLFGFNVFRAEGIRPKDMELIRVIQHPDTAMIDTVAMGTTNRKVLYVIVPIDYHSNAARANDTLVLYRPDVTPPEPPKTVYFAFENEKASIKWLPSTSEDVAAYKLYKQDLPDTATRFVADVKLAKDTLRYVTESMEEEKSTNYLLRAIDQEGLISNDSNRVEIKLNRPHRLPGVDTLFISYDDTKQEVVIKWKYNYHSKKRQIQSFFLSKLTPGTDFNKLGIVSGDTFEYRDPIQASGTYFYRVLAESTDGIISVKGKPISIKVKVKKKE